MRDPWFAAERLMGFGLILIGIGLLNLTSGERWSYFSGLLVGFGIGVFVMRLRPANSQSTPDK